MKKHASSLSHWFPVILAVLLLTAAGCSNMMDYKEREAIEPKKTFTLATADGGTITVTALDTDSDGKIDGLDLDGDAKSAEITFSVIDTKKGTYAVDIDNDDDIDFYILVDYDGTILANSAIDNKGQEVTIVTNSSGDLIGIDYSEEYSGADYTFGANPPPAPEAPSLESGHQQLTVTWDAVVNADSYKVYYHTVDIASAAVQFLGDADDTDTSCVITGLTNGTTYYVWIRANNANGDSDYSAAASSTPNPTPVPATPTPTTAPTPTPAGTADLFWCESDNNQIMKANLDGTGASILVANAFTDPWAIGAGGGYVFWSGSSGNIHRVNTDGTSVTQEFMSINDEINGIFVDSTNSKVYWSEYNNSRIRRANLDGSGVETMINLTSEPFAVATDGTYIYWSAADTSEIKRALLDGSGETAIINSVEAYGFGIDTVNSKLYIADYGNGKIFTADLDGSNQTDVITGIIGPGCFDGIEYWNGKIYWNDDDSCTISSRDADGSGSTTTIDSDNSDYESGVCIGY